MENLPDCPKCGSSNTHVRFYKKLKKGQYRPRVKCEDCGKPFIASEQYDQYLTDEIEKLPNAIIEHRADGSVMVNKVLAMTEEDAKKPERVLELAGFDPEEWKVIRCRINAWNGQRAKDRGQLINHQVKLDVEPKKPDDFTLEDIDRFFKDYKPTKTEIKVGKSNKGGDIAEIILADLHVGNTTIDIDARADYVVDKMLDRIRHLKLEKIYLVFLGDTIHIDTMNRTTTKGTPIEARDHPYNIYDKAAAIAIRQIEKVAQIAPVEVIPIYGNHDRFISYALFSGLEMYFRNRKGIQVDKAQLDVKYRKFGKCLVLWDHGDKAKAQLENQIFQEARKEFGETLFAEIHSAHIHKEKVDEPGNGVKIRRTPTITNPDEWHMIKGFKGSLRCSQAFIWSKQEGLIYIVLSNV